MQHRNNPQKRCFVIFLLIYMSATALRHIKTSAVSSIPYKTWTTLQICIVNCTCVYCTAISYVHWNTTASEMHKLAIIHTNNVQNVNRSPHSFSLSIYFKTQHLLATDPNSSQPPWCSPMDVFLNDYKYVIMYWRMNFLKLNI